MHLTYSELKEIHDGLLSLFGKKDSDIDALEGSPSADDTVVIMHNNINKKTTVGNLIGHDTPLAPVATSGSYNDLSDKPSIPAAQVNADWNASSGVAQILNKPTIPAAQIQSDWDQSDNTAKDFIKNKPDLSSGGTSYITYTITGNPAQISWNTQDSKLQTVSTGVYHTVILQPPTNDIANYDLTECVSFYLGILSNAEPSVIKIEFVAYRDDNPRSHTTFIDTEEMSDVVLYGKFESTTSTSYDIASPNNVKTRCCITIIKTDSGYDIICECLGNIINNN